MTKSVFYPQQLSSLPSFPGVYFYYSAGDSLLYIGKAKNLKNRISSYFTGPLLPKTASMVSQIAKIKILQTLTETDALLLEAELIRKYQPKYNSELKDNKSYLRIKIIDGIIKFVHNETDRKARYFGPYPDSGKVRRMLHYLRKVFPFYTQYHKPGEICFRGHLGLCPCINGKYNLSPIIKILSGKRIGLLKDLTKQMKTAAKKSDFEAALKLKNQIDILSNLGVPTHEPWEYQINPNLVAEQNINKVKTLCSYLKIKYKDNFRIEGYDISHLSGTNVVASMVVNTEGAKDTKEYRRFKIKVDKNNDAAAMNEVLNRRFNHPEWPFPDLILVDGPVRIHFEVPIIGLEKRLETIILPDGSKISLPKSNLGLQLLIAVRDEAHRFAQSYHKKLRSKNMLTLKA